MLLYGGEWEVRGCYRWMNLTAEMWCHGVVIWLSEDLVKGHLSDGQYPVR